ncbi:MAG TPA: ribonuclease P protein component [Helicobacter sp.]|nr:ribonuclease P protein component [Helicobacter sp.]
MKKQYRVKKNTEIEAILKKKRYSSNPYFSLYVKKQDETNHFRYAISVSKKIGNAVVRNKLKRQIRSIIRVVCFKDGYDFFIIARPKILGTSYLEKKQALLNLFIQQNLIIKGKD